MLKQVLLRNTEGTVQRVEDAKVTVFGCGIEASATEAKGTVLIRSAEELMNYNKSEEKLMEEVRHHLKVDSPLIEIMYTIYTMHIDFT
jgi:NifU-like protein involved in Fe-S cluster formation